MCFFSPSVGVTTGGVVGCDGVIGGGGVVAGGGVVGCDGVVGGGGVSHVLPVYPS